MLQVSPPEYKPEPEPERSTLKMAGKLNTCDILNFKAKFHKEF